MESGQASGIKRFILWDYPRASWQYDVMVALILAFIFLTPRSFFQDYPRVSSLVRLSSDGNVNMYWVQPELLAATPEASRTARIEKELLARYGRREKSIRVEPQYTENNELEGYKVFTKP